MSVDRSGLPPLRSYQSWIANETLEDYSLRFAAKSFRKWSSIVIANTAIGGISFLALEAIGGAITLSYGFANAFLFERRAYTLCVLYALLSLLLSLGALFAGLYLIRRMFAPSF